MLSLDVNYLGVLFMINLAVAMRQHEWFDGLWDRSKTFALPVKFTPIFSP